MKIVNNKIVRIIIDKIKMIFNFLCAVGNKIIEMKNSRSARIMVYKATQIFNLFIGRRKHSNIDQLRYLSQSALIEESVAPYMIRTILFMSSVVILMLIFWSGITKVDEIAITNGEVIPNKYVQAIQHLEGGIISEININEGDLVEAGQILLTLDGNEVKQDLSALEAKNLAYKYQLLRLKAFIYGTDPDFSSLADNEHKEIADSQLRAFQSMIAAKETERSILNQQISQKEDALAMLEKKQGTLQDNFKLVAEERNLKKQLLDKGHISRFKFLEVEKEYNEIEGELDETVSGINQAKTSIQEYRDRLSSLEAKYKDDAYRELTQLESDMAQLQENIEKLQAEVSRLEIRSSSYGYVKSLKVKTIGAVIQSGQILVEIVPLEGNLIVETQINPKDVGHIQIGQKVTVKFSSYDFSRYGTVEGKLEYISATTFVNTDNSRYYLGRVSLSKNYVGNDPKYNIILPGMTVQADIITGNKSILAYLLKPIHTSVSTAFSER